MTDRLKESSGAGAIGKSVTLTRCPESLSCFTFARRTPALQSQPADRGTLLHARKKDAMTNTYSAHYRDGQIYLQIQEGDSIVKHELIDAIAHRLSIELAEARLQRDREELAAMKMRLEEWQKGA